MHNACAIFSKLGSLASGHARVCTPCRHQQELPTPVSQKARKTPKSIPKSTKFEDALAELESIVQTLEGGEQSLDVSLEQFERGVSLSRFCQQSLSAAEQKVKILLDQDGDEEALQPFDDVDATP